MTPLPEKIDAYINGHRWIAQDNRGRQWTATTASKAVRYTANDGGAVWPLDRAIIIDAYGGRTPNVWDKLQDNRGDLTATQLVVLGRLTARALKETKDE